MCQQGHRTRKNTEALPMCAGVRLGKPKPTWS